MNLCDNKLIDSYFRSSSYEEMLSALFDLLEHKLELESIAIYELKDKKFKIKISRGFSSFYIKNFLRDLNDSQIDQIVNAEAVTKIKIDNDLVGKSPNGSLFFPLVAQKEILGFIYIGRNKDFSQDEINFFKNMSIITTYILKSNKLEESSGKLNILDNLTEAYNIHYFYLRLHESIEKLETLNRSFSIYYIKYRYFTKIKKIYWKEKNHKSFQKIVAKIKDIIRAIDNIFRFQEDGFVVLLESDLTKKEFEIIQNLDEDLDDILKDMGLKIDIDKALLNISEEIKIDDLINLMEEAI